MFSKEKYCLIPRLLSVEIANYLFDYVVERASHGELSTDSRVPTAFSAYGDPVMEGILELLCPIISHHCECTLLPTYSYYRVYGNGDFLPRHRDREACEITASLNLGQKPGDIWPLWLAKENGNFPAMLGPGDALIYRGGEYDHWRDPFMGETAAQVFFHFVDANGPFALWKFDKRKSLNTL